MGSKRWYETRSSPSFTLYGCEPAFWRAARSFESEGPPPLILPTRAAETAQADNPEPSVR